MNLLDAQGNHILSPESQLSVTATAAAGSAVTLTIPAVAGSFHYIGSIIITKFATAALTAAASPVTITTTNLPGSMAWDFSAGADAQGTLERLTYFMGAAPIKSSVVNTATTIVCPATTSVIWRVTVTYTTANS